MDGSRTRLRIYHDHLVFRMEDKVVAESSSGAPAEGERPCALVVDDEAGVRLVARRVLERKGWAVREAADGAQALSELVHRVDPPHYDLVLCDIRMPQIDGIHVYAELVIHRPDVLPHLVLYSGSLSDPDVVRFLQRTGIRVIAKPFDMAELLSVAEAARRA